MTPPTIASYPSADHWDIRIVENLYPVLGAENGSSSLLFGLQQAIDGYGRHEVVIDHPQHGISLQEMSQTHLSSLFRTYRDRMRELYEGDDRLRYVLAFKNFGPAAGASIPHTHSQIIAMPVVPENVHAEVECSRNHYRKHHRCIFCSLIDEALTFEATIYDRDSGEIRRRIGVGDYVVERSDCFIAIKPFASRFEWEIHILPLVHQADFTKSSDASLEDFAGLLKRTMARLDAVVGGVQYNYFLHARPQGEEFADCAASYHWHLEICPRTTIPTGFELGSGLFVSTISPEDAARQLREVVL
jgi:UDPglucose--hexose-1-phosphate uridylyltransferase